MSVAATVAAPVVSAPASNPPSSSGGTTGSTTSSATLASNFQTFLTLLTTQLQNQNPLDPLDTNQFTQQLVQFAQVEQQLKQNDQLAALISIQKTTQATQALNFVGNKVVVDGTTASLKDGPATWSLSSPKDANATVNILNKVGQTVYSGTYNVNAGRNDFIWDGKGNDGVQWPEGEYKIQVIAKDASGQDVVVSADSQGVVDSVDLTASPPLLSIGTRTFTVDQIKRIVQGNSV